MIDNAINHASNWFQIHANQRLKLINFYVILLAGSLALFGSAIEDKNDLLEVLVGASILVITFVFKKLDQRTAFLVKIEENALSVIEKRMATNLNFEEIKLIDAAKKTKGILTYRKSFNYLFCLGYLLGIFGLIHGGN